jgi:ATP-dependent helicase/nuclease subunit A
MPTLTQQQRDAVETIDKHVLVCAGAGSGKTHVLVERYIELLQRNQQLGVSNLVAVTFTRKAAAEMKTRLKSRFRDLMTDAQDVADDLQRSRWSQCLSEIDSARIGTIHSLCESILKAFPVDAKIDPQFEVLSDLMQAELLVKCIDQAFRDIVEHDSDEQSLLFEFPLEEIRKLVSRALKSSLQLEEAIARFPMDDADLLTAHIEKYILQARKMCLADLLRQAEWHGAVAYLEDNAIPGNKVESFRLEAIECAKTIEDGVDIEACWRALSNLGNNSPRTTGGNSDEIKEIRSRIKILRELAREVCERIPSSLSEQDEAALKCLRALVKLIQRALSIYKSEKKSKLVIDYNDLIEIASRALSDPKSMVRRFYNETISTVLVDEFQDTNTVQSKLITAIAGANAKLFFIGDDKQSIYRFQGADVATFNSKRMEFAEMAGDALNLSLNTSFRSHPSVVQFVNVVFAQIMSDAAPDAGHRASFERLLASREDKLGHENIELVVFEDLDSDGQRKSPRLPAIEAKAVADWILEKVEGGLRIVDKSSKTERAVALGDVAVLVQRNKDFAAIEREFADRNIPFVLLGGRGYLQRQEVFDIENLLRFISSPQDEHSLLGVLRSPLFAISDDIIHQLAVEEFGSAASTLWQRIQTAAKQNSGGMESISKAVSILKKLITDSSILPVSEIVRQLIAMTQFDLILLTLPNGRQRARNIWKMVALAEENDHLGCGEFARDLSLMREYDVKQADAPVDTANAVKLMTVHASKGLEFPLVALPVLSTRALNKKDRLLYHREYGLAFDTTRLKEDIAPTWYQVAKALDDDMDIAERKRLLYVAMTRARDHLALFVDRDGDNNQSFRRWLQEAVQFDTQSLSKELQTKMATSGTEQAPFSMRSCEELSESVAEIFAAKETDTDGSGGSVANLAKLTKLESKYDLVAPLPMTAVGLPNAWQGAIRVTPKAGKVAITATAMGTFFHALMEHLPPSGRTLTPSEIEDLAFAQHDIIPTSYNLSYLAEEGKRLLELFYKSKLFEIVKKARRRLHEIPYVMLSDEEAENRRPDLLVEDEHGQWQLIDFKTDHIESKDLERQTKHHAKQLLEYAHELGQLFQVKMHAYVYYAQLAVLIECKSK